MAATDCQQQQQQHCSSSRGAEELHLQWRVRGGGNAVVGGLLVFPNNQELKKVETGRAQDRVYLQAAAVQGLVAALLLLDAGGE